MKRQIRQARLARVVLMMVCNVGLMTGPAVAQTYTVTDVGTLGGTQTTPVAINASGQVTGAAEALNSTDGHAFLYSGGVMTDLGTAGGTYSAGFAINDVGQVTRETSTATDELHAFLYSNGVMTDLGTLGGRMSRGVAINAVGQVTGTSDLAGNGAVHAFLVSDGAMTDVGTFGGSYTVATAINSAGQVTGYSATLNDQEAHAFVYSRGVLTDLNDVIPSGSGWILNYADAINDSGHITGSGVIDGEVHTFLLTPVATTLAQVQPPIHTDGSSVFGAKRGVIPVRFTLTVNGAPTCQLPAATIAITRTAGGTIGAVDESVYVAAADQGSNFRVSDCGYVYNLAASSLGTGHYRVDIAIDGTAVGHAEFSLK